MSRGIRAVTATSVEVSFTIKGRLYRERIKCNPNADADITAIENWLAVVNEKIRDGSFNYAEAFPNSKKRLEFLNPSLVGDYLKGWLQQNQKFFKASTFGMYRKVIDSQFQDIMPRLMVELKFKHIKAAANKLNVGQKTLNNYLSVLRKAFADAEQDEQIAGFRNPLHNRSIQLRTVRVKKDATDPFNLQEIKFIIDAATGINRLMLIFSFNTGLRPSELIALQWKNVKNGVAHIVEVQTEASKGLEEPKTTSSIRAVKLNSLAIAALQQARQYTRLQNEQIFTNPITDQRYNGDQGVRRLFKRTCLKANVRYRHPYQMRHTYASTSLMAGETAGFISSQLGHKTIDFTLKTYVKYIADNNPGAGDKFEKMMQQKAVEKL